MKRFTVEVYSDNDVTKHDIYLALIRSMGNAIAGVTDESQLAAAQKRVEELEEKLEALLGAFETNVRDCDTWVQYRNARALLKG